MARSPKSGFQQGWFLLRAVTENVFRATLLTCGGLLVTFGLPGFCCSTLITWCSPCECVSVSVSKFSFFIKTPVTLN